MRRLIRVTVYFFVFLLLLILSSNLWIIWSTADKMYDRASEIPSNNVGLVLGTSNRTARGEPNPFFQNRIEAAYQLFKAGKVKHFILSGDNRSVYYNEPVMMQRALLSKGVPDSVITLDYAGLRTLDSIIRCKEIFGQDSITVVTQSFHGYRALFISEYYNLNAVVLAAESPGIADAFPVRIREYLARFVAVMDLYVLGTAPRFMGQKEELNIPS